MVMTAEGGSEETMSSPRNRVKFLCSHSGKILPRPPDGQLKYVGGETRVVAVPRNIDFSGLMTKLSGLCEGDMVLKYQLIPDEFDILVSVRCDEDLRHMLAEYDRQESNTTEGGGSPRLRTFLFPSHPTVLERQQSSNSTETQELEKRYVDAINGVRDPKNTKRNSLNTGRSIFSISSASSSPTSAQPETSTNDTTTNHDVFASNGFGNNNCNVKGFQRVSSSPSLSNLGQQSHYYPSHHHYHHHHQNHHQQQAPQPYSHQPYRLQGNNNNNGTAGRLVSALSIGRSDINGRSQLVGPANPAVRYHAPSKQQIKGCSGCTGCGG